MLRQTASSIRRVWGASWGRGSGGSNNFQHDFLSSTLFSVAEITKSQLEPPVWSLLFSAHCAPVYLKVFAWLCQLVTAQLYLKRPGCTSRRAQSGFQTINVECGDVQASYKPTHLSDLSFGDPHCTQLCIFRHIQAQTQYEAMKLRQHKKTQCPTLNPFMSILMSIKSASYVPVRDDCWLKSHEFG